MSGSKDDFWKDLMGEDFQVDEPAFPQPGTPPGSEKAPGENGISPGFTIEYVSRDGAPAAPGQRPGGTPPAPRPAQTPNPAPQRPQTARPSNGGGDLFDEMSRTLSDPGHSKAPEEPYSSEPVYTPPARESQPQPRPAAPKNLPQSKPQGSSGNVPQSAPEARPARQSGQEPPPAARQRRPRKSREDKFEVEFDFDAEYPDVNEKAIRRGRTKRTGCLSGILLFLFVICVSVVLACVGWMWATDVLGFDGRDQTVEITLPREIFHQEDVEEEDKDGNTVTVTKNVADIDAVADELYNQGLIKYKWLFKLFSKFSHADTKVQAGTWTLNLNYDYRAIVHGMTARSGKRETVTLTIPEGFSITQIVALMEENGVCGKDELLDSLTNTDFDYDFLKDSDVPALGNPKRLEGYLFPDTYEFYKDDDPDAVIKRFLNNFGRKWTEEFDTMAAELGYTRQQILNVASMIEKEAGTDAERDSIASVIYNRLEHPEERGTNGLLQIDATINYVIADTGGEFSQEIDSPYNTYKYPGLPAGPISNPGLASIRAALKPANTDYYYYALGLNKSHRFFTNYQDFVAFVNSDQYGG